METSDIGRSVQRAFKYYKKHYDDINALFEIAGLPTASQGAVDNKLPTDLIALQTQADQSLELLKQHTGAVDELNQIPPQNLQTQKPELCAALISYKKDLDALFSALQTVRAQAPKPKKKGTRRAKTQKF